MHSLLLPAATTLPATTVPTSSQLWAYGQALREIDSAIADLEDAAATLIGLVADTGWQSDGVRALHERLRGFQQDTRVETARLRDRRAELEGVPIV